MLVNAPYSKLATHDLKSKFIQRVYHIGKKILSQRKTFLLVDYSVGLSCWVIKTLIFTYDFYEECNFATEHGTVKSNTLFHSEVKIDCTFQ